MNPLFLTGFYALSFFTGVVVHNPAVGTITETDLGYRDIFDYAQVSAIGNGFSIDCANVNAMLFETDVGINPLPYFEGRNVAGSIADRVYVNQHYSDIFWLNFNVSTFPMVSSDNSGSLNAGLASTPGIYLDVRPCDLGVIPWNNRQYYFGEFTPEDRFDFPNEYLPIDDAPNTYVDRDHFVGIYDGNNHIEYDAYKPYDYHIGFFYNGDDDVVNVFFYYSGNFSASNELYDKYFSDNVIFSTFFGMTPNDDTDRSYPNISNGEFYNVTQTHDGQYSLSSPMTWGRRFLLLGSFNLQTIYEDETNEIQMYRDWGLANGRLEIRLFNVNYLSRYNSYYYYDAGYQAGYSDAESGLANFDSSPFGFFFRTLNSFTRALNIEIFPGFTLIGIISIPIIAGILFFIMKMLRGS